MAIKLSTKMPRHIGIVLHNIEPGEMGYDEAFDRVSLALLQCINWSTKLNIPIISFYCLPANYSQENAQQIIDGWTKIFQQLAKLDYLNANQVKLTVLGKWYNLPGRLVDAIKSAIESTKDYDKYFVNLCMNYDGQEEIVDACKLIARQVKAGKLDPESVTKEIIKENTYTSYFLPLDIIISASGMHSSEGFLMWDSTGSFIHVCENEFMFFKKEDFLEAIKCWQDS